MYFIESSIFIEYVIFRSDLQFAIASNDIVLINNAKDKMTEVMLYCIQDAELVIDLMEHLR